MPVGFLHRRSVGRVHAPNPPRAQDPRLARRQRPLGQTRARQAHGQKISEAKLRRHERLVDPDGRLDPAERRQLATNSLRAEMARLAYKRARKTVKDSPDAAA